MSLYEANGFWYNPIKHQTRIIYSWRLAFCSKQYTKSCKQEEKERVEDGGLGENLSLSLPEWQPSCLQLIYGAMKRGWGMCGTLVILQFATVSMNILTWHFSLLKSTTCYMLIHILSSLHLVS